MGNQTHQGLGAGCVEGFGQSAMLEAGGGDGVGRMWTQHSSLDRACPLSWMCWRRGPTGMWSYWEMVKGL